MFGVVFRLVHREYGVQFIHRLEPRPGCWRARALASRVVAFITAIMVPATALLRVGVGADPGEVVGEWENGRTAVWHGGDYSTTYQPVDVFSVPSSKHFGHLAASDST